ncbi:OmpL47-type beta-barrel domain-containing protein [Cohnella thailandensis]|uniref:Right-handed parallel beta-helix repeat-containing protein n=1 Tax=Cohnella thailandensis TaxID=557557 RepID=A0A841SXX9_9BACL|nr:right-handed parallel beta-helix repeat-containing protein [Cohnella thailandensis]MBB6635779.1 right-handed parallel beta-helix repeat-containing protein [Cohnella thailandensis]MBP1976157.1 hypothetical protein [Cohnella thailandensis]
MYKKPKWMLSLAVAVALLLLAGLPPAPSAYAEGTTYHVATTGSNSADGSASAPFQTINHCAQVARPGDTCLIESGTYRETVKPARSGTDGLPITFAAAPGADVTVSGMEPIGGWTPYSGSIYVADLSWDLKEQNQLLVNGSGGIEPLWEARWPNIGAHSLQALQQGVATATGGSATTLVSTALTEPSGYWTGATLWERGGDAYVAQTTKVTGYDQATHTLTFNPIPNSYDYMDPEAGTTFYLSGIFGELDAPNEWYVDGEAGKVYLWAPGGGVPTGIEAKKRLTVFDLSGLSYIHLTGLRTVGGSIHIDNGASHNVLDRMEALYLYTSTESHGTSVQHQLTNGINISGSNNEIKNSEIAYSSGTLINIDGSGNRIVNNIVHDGSYMASYDPLIKLSYGSENLISHNDIYNSGRYNIYWRTGSAKIQYNDIYDGMWLSRDGALIYSWGTDMGNSEIARNLIHDSRGTDMSVGLYFDNFANNAIVHHNVIYNNNVGIQLNTPGNYRLIYNNTVANNDLTSVGYWGNAPYSQELYGTRVYNNIFTGSVSLTSDAESGFNILSGSGVGFANAVGGDYRLTAGSTAINAGAVIPGIADDYAGSAPDAGAYEYGGADWTAGADLNNPPNPQYTAVNTPYMNMVKNNGFESGGTGWLLWSTSASANTFGDVPNSPADQFRGKNRRLVLGPGGGIEQKVTGLKPDTDYVFVAWVMNAPNSTNERIIGGVLNYGGTTTDIQTTSTTYTRLEIPFRTGATNTDARIRLYKPSNAQGVSYADDTGVIETTEFDPGVDLSTLKEVRIEAPNPVYTEGDQGTLPLTGVLQNDQAADLSAADIQYTSSDDGVLRIDGVADSAASFTALAPGQVTVTAAATLGGVVKAASQVVTVFPQGTPQEANGWSVRTYGANGRGFATENNGTISLVGKGDNVWNTSDDFVYLSRSYSLNNPNAKVTLTATIDSLGAGDPASVGLMLRAQDTADSKHVHFRTDGTGKVLRFVFRNEESILDAQKPPAQQKYWGSATGLALDYAGKSIEAPFRMKLVKEGNSVTGYYDKDGQWLTIGSTTVEFNGGGFLAGIGLFSGAGKLPVKAVISGLDVQIEGETADAEPPSTTADAALPASGGWAASDVAVTLTAIDSDSGVERTEYRLNGSGDWLPYAGPVLLDREGGNLLEYRSFDKAGNEEPIRSFEVSIDKTKPTLSVQLDRTEIWPANHKMAKVNATVDASDGGGSGLASIVLTSVASSEPGTEGDIDAQIGTDARSFSLKAEKDRTYTVTYTAADHAGNRTTGTATVTVPHDQSGK